jgi:hypothetical protein
MARHQYTAAEDSLVMCECAITPVLYRPNSFIVPAQICLRHDRCHQRIQCGCKLTEIQLFNINQYQRNVQGG